MLTRAKHHRLPSEGVQMADTQRGMGRRAAGIGVGLLLTGLGVGAAVWDLDRADKIASIVGAAAGTFGLALAGYSLWGMRQSRPDQSIASTTIAGGVTQVRGTTGNVRITRMTGDVETRLKPINRQPTQIPPLAEPIGGQTISQSQIDGTVTQVDGTGGDVEIER
ncbi:hypothetical protein Ais01nite_41870 [Asanoa ishikariensis]|nr:hypothetical protein Ais01nite_41870 [Asanoa ishikariensis]